VLRRFVGPVVLASAALFPGIARAQDAQALFDQGLEDMKAGRYKIGCAFIKRSLDIDARPGTAFTLAECYSKAGKSASAVEMYDQYLALYDAMPPDQQRQQAARADLSRSERTRLFAIVSWVTVTLPSSAPAGVVVTRDGEAYPSNLLGVAIATDPGAHVFTTHAPSGPLIEQRVEVAAGERKELQLEVRTAESAAETEESPPTASPEAPDTTEPTEERGTNPWLYVTIGGGAAGFLTYAVAGAILLDKRSTIQSECHPDKRLPDGSIPCSPEGKKAADLAKGTLVPLTEVGLGVGLVGAAATVLLLVLDDSSSSGDKKATARPVVELGTAGATFGVKSAW